MAKGGNSLNSKRSRAAKPYDANNSFVKKVATKVTDLIPQRSWISKWFNSSQDNGEMLNDTENREDSDNEQEEPAQPPPSKRPRIRMDVTHPPGTFDIQPRSRTLVNSNEVDPCKEQYPVHNETNDDFLEPPVAGTSGTRRLVASTPAIQSEIRTTNSQRNRADFISLTSSQNQNNGAANGTDDNSESSESTSGCSSLIPQVNRQEASASLGYNRSFTNRKRYIDDKLNFTNHLQSPRSLFLDSNPRDSLSSRRPSFNASVMNSSLERGPSFASPFYNGNTTFGGANTAGFQRRGRTLFNSVNELQLKVPNRTNIQVKSPNAAGTDSSGMSQTAKRILEALEHFSSPILDAKKIPMNSNNTSVSSIGGKKRQRNESGAPLARVGLRHLTRELTVPTVPDLLKLRRRQRLQDTTVAARRIVSARSAPPPSPQEYRLRSNDDEKSKYAGKVKAKDKTDLEDDLIPEAVNLPNISLPITVLPTFDIMMPVITSNKGRGAKEELFKFASPIKVTDTSRNLKSINNFTFSKPIIANDIDSTDDSHTLSRTLTVESNSSTLSTSSLSSTSNFMWSRTTTAPKLKEKYIKEKEKASDGVEIANNLKTGSVMDILGKKSDPLMDAWKPAAGMWECSQCLIRNAKDEAQCVACKASKTIPKVDKSVENSTASSTIKTSQSKPMVADCFGSQFKMSGNQWECDACLVRNKQTDIKCISCTTPRPGSIKVPPISSISSLSTSEKSDLMEKFKAPEGSWECPGCMLRNPGIVESCPCCNASKPGSLKISPKRLPADSNSSTSITNSCNDENSSKNDFAQKSKSAKGFWGCLNCKVKNPSSLLICPCSSAKKSDSTNAAVSGFGDKFKKPEGAWACDDCMLQNEGDTSECIACGAARPGSKKTTKSTSISSSGSSLQFNFGMPKNTGGFKFGIDKKEEKIDAGKSEPLASGFSFGAKTTESPKATGFTFGVPLQSSTGFTFGVPNIDKNSTELKNDTKENTTTENVAKKRSLNTEEPKNPSTFSFGVPKTEETKSDTKKFAFGVQPATTVSSGPSFSFGGTKTDSTLDKSNNIPKVNFDIPSSNHSELNFSSLTNEKPSIALASNQSNPLATKLSDKVDIKPPVNPTFAITIPVATTGGLTITTSTNSAPTPGLFTFGSTTTIPNQSNASQAQSFGQTSIAQPAVSVPASVPTAAMFLFGTNKPTNGTTTTAPPEKSPSLSFGGTTGPEFAAANVTPLFEGNENKLVPTFGVSENKAASLFGGTETKPAVFGAQDSKITPFGNIKKPATTAFSPAAPAFGAPSTTSAFGSTTPAFGTAPTPTFGASSTTSMFAASKPAENVPPVPTNSGLFGFGGNAVQPTPQSSTGFNFSANSPTPTPALPLAQKNLFTFGNTSTTQQPGTGFGTTTNFNASAAPESTPAGFAFNPPKPDPSAFGQTAPVTTPMFGASQNTPSFGQSQATPAFGAPAPAPSSGFNFGGSAPVATSGFNFGGQVPAAAPAAGFAFNAPSPSPAVAFDPNTPPTFNFTGGSAPTAFSATPQTPQRKIKKAVRRTQPR